MRKVICKDRKCVLQPRQKGGGSEGLMALENDYLFPLEKAVKKALKGIKKRKKQKGGSKSVSHPSKVKKKTSRKKKKSCRKK